MPEPYTMNLYDLPAVDNVCNQILREVVSLPHISMAHVSMEPGNVSLLHRHSKTAEIYYMLDGEGILYQGNQVFRVFEGDHIVIDPGTPHKLFNLGAEGLEHLVFAAPPFDPEDVEVLEQSESQDNRYLGTYRRSTVPIVAQDGAIVHELLSRAERESLGAGIAQGMLPPKRTARLHLHEKTEEVYYVVSGKGKVRLADSTSPVEKGSVIYIPKGTVHGLDNTSDSEQLEVLCLSDPPYSDDDFIPV